MNQAAPTPTIPKSLPRRAYDTLSSFGLTVVILVLMLFITWKGTLAQVDLGLYEAQKKYFESLFIIERAGPIPVFLPGGYLLMGALFVNLALGGMVRLRRTKATIGIFVIHIGIALMLIAGFVKFHHSSEGALRLYVGQQKTEFVSYHDWELVIGAPVTGGQDAQDGEWREYVVPGERFIALGIDDRLSFTHDDLPFRTELHGFTRNAMVRPDSGDGRTSQAVVDGFWIERRPLDSKAERNLAAAYVDVVPTSGSTTVRGLVWGVQKEPLVAEVDGTRYTIDLRKRRFPLDFTMRLDEFQKTDYPGTTKPVDYRSWVTKVEDGVEQQTEISMNEPLRHQGYIFFQSAFDQPDRASNGEMYSIFAVVRNPSDQWPLYSCIIIAAGLLLHFGRKLFRYARTQSAGA